MRGVQHRARAEEQQPLEHRVIDGVIQTRDERQRRQQRMAHVQFIVVQKHQRCAEAHQDDADVFDAVIGQQPFQVVLHQGIQHAEHGGNRADGQHRHAPPHRWIAEKIKKHPRHAVDTHLDEHAGHERGHVAGRDRMSGRQPGVQRHDARLDAEADQEQQKRGVARTGGHPVRIFGQRMKAGKGVSLRAVIA